MISSQNTSNENSLIKAHIFREWLKSVDSWKGVGNKTATIKASGFFHALLAYCYINVEGMFL